jgi:hypothetical protein
MGYRETRSWVHGLFKVGAGGRTGGYIDHIIMVLIVLNVIAVMLETVDSLYASYAAEFSGSKQFRSQSSQSNTSVDSERQQNIRPINIRYGDDCDMQFRRTWLSTS